jgi:hypothetical protein
VKFFFFLRTEVNQKSEKRKEAGPSEDILAEVASQPRPLESRDIRREVVQAISQLSHTLGLEVSQVHEFMDQIRERNNTNPDNARVRHPKDGDIFVFFVDTIQMSCLHVLSDDEYSWTSKNSQDHGGLKIRHFTYRPHDQPYNQFGHKEGHFMKSIYYRKKDQTCLIHYRGDHTEAQPKLKYRSGQDKLAGSWAIKQRILEVDPDRKMGPTEVLTKLKQTYVGGNLSVGLPQSRDQVKYYQKQLYKQAAKPSETTTVTSATVASLHKGAGSASWTDSASLGVAQASFVLSRLPSIPTSLAGVGGTWNPIMTSTPHGQTFALDYKFLHSTSFDGSRHEDMSYMNVTPIFAKHTFTSDDGMDSPGRMPTRNKKAKTFQDQDINEEERERSWLKGRKISFDFSVKNVVEISDQLKENQLRMGPLEHRRFQKQSLLYTFETKEPGLVIIHTMEEDEVSASVRRAAATAGANQALSRQNLRPESARAYIVKVSICVEGKPELMHPEEFEVSCVCGKAMSRRELGPNTINCTTCQRMFHKEHVDNPLEEKGFKCVACSQPIKGLKYGSGKYFNTSSIDGFLTSVSLAFKHTPSLLQDLKAYGAVAEQHLADSIELAQKNCSGEAQTIWGDYIVNFGPQRVPFRSTTDLYGDVFARTVEALGPSVTFNLKTFCPNGNLCLSKKKSTQTIRSFSLPSDCSSVKMGLDFMLEEKVKQCDTCVDDRGLPSVGHMKITIPDLKEPPLFLYLNTEKLKFTPEDYMQGPQEILLHGIKYILSSIHLFSACSAHNRTLIQVGKGDSPSWLLYDGIAQQTDKNTGFRPALPSDFTQEESTEGFKIISVVYLRE